MIGRPTLYNTSEDLNNAIDEYFASCKPEPLYYDDKEGIQHIAIDKNGKPIILENPATMAGLAYFLGYSTRQAIYDLETKNDDFSYAIKRARLNIEAYHESSLCTRDKCTGNIFWLKNHGWYDRTEVEHSGKLEGLTIEIVKKIDVE